MVWYWTVPRDINSYADCADIVEGSAAVNGRSPQSGRANGIDDRIRRLNPCCTMGPERLNLTAKGPAGGETATGHISVSDTQDIGNSSAGVDANGWPLPFRYAYSRYPREFTRLSPTLTAGRGTGR